MCCYTSGVRLQIHKFLSELDENIDSPAKFWHTQPVKGFRDTPTLLDSVWLRASRTLHTRTAAEQTRITAQWMKIREELMTTNSPSVMNSLQRYVNPAMEQPKHSGALALSAAVLIALTSMVGIAAPANAGSVAKPLTVSAPVKKKCVDNAKKILVKKGQKVQWERRDGKVITKTMKKNRRVCPVNETPPVHGGVTISTGGKVTALPSNFPLQPTYEDIQGLGLTATTAVSPKLRIPQPTAPIAKARPADAIKAVSVRTERVPKVVASTLDGDIIDGEVDIIYVTWEIVGGEGVMDFGASGVKLNPNGSVLVERPNGEANFRNGQQQVTFMARGVTDDYGQLSLPQSTTRNWVLPNPHGSQLGVNANPAAPNFGSFMDGVGTLTSDMTLR